MTRPEFWKCGYWLLFAASSVAAVPLAANEPAIEGYRSYDQMRRELEEIAGHEAASLETLGTTLGGREIFLLTLSLGDADEKPAILVVGSAHAPHLLGSEMAVRMARRLAEGAESDEAIRELLEEQTIYVIPRPSPDASEAFFHKPFSERTGNARATDDDRDGRTNEDGPEDLNGDGQITLMRVEDPTGKYIPHPEDDRVLIEAETEQGEQGRYRLLTEGFDNDDDGQHAEDGPGGVAFDRNFTFEYPYFEAGAGPHQVSEPETRAVADFAFDHRNIYLVFSLSLHDNLMHPWKPGEDRNSIPTRILRGDAPYLEHMAEMYQQAIDAKDAPDPPDGDGSFVHWAYFHYGRWSLGARGWWIPHVNQEEVDQAEKGTNDKGPDANGDSTEEPSARDQQRKDTKERRSHGNDDKRGADDLNAIRWMEQQGIEGFTEWTNVEHPDFDGRRVEVGGFHPFVRLNPPVRELEKLGERHTKFLRDVAALRARLTLSIDKIDDLGGGVFRITSVLRNDGYLPTESALGSRAETLQRLDMQITLPEDASLVHGVRRVSVNRLTGHGGSHEHEWLVHVPEDVATKTIKITAGSPTAGTVETTEQLP